MTGPPLVPLPVSDAYDRGESLQQVQQGQRQSWGHCADFCIQADSAQTSGLTVAKHGGPLCRSGSLAHIDALDLTGQRATLWPSVVQPYMHGTYEPGSRLPLPDPLIELSLIANGVAPDEGDAEARSFYVSAGDALRLASALVRAAEVVDGLDRNFNGARAAREDRA